MTNPLSIIPIEGVGEIRPGDELAVFIARAAEVQETPLRDGDCLVVTQKVVSKAENRLVPLDPDDLDARRALVESESVRIVRRRGDLIISETRHGFVCANAGVDLSNVEDGHAALLPVDADRSARRIRDGLRARAGVEVALLEKHADFLRDFRGDTIHPSTLELMGELGLLDEFLKLPISDEDKRKILWDNCATFYGAAVAA